MERPGFGCQQGDTDARMHAGHSDTSNGANTNDIDRIFPFAPWNACAGFEGLVTRVPVSARPAHLTCQGSGRRWRHGRSGPLQGAGSEARGGQLPLRGPLVSAAQAARNTRPAQPDAATNSARSAGRPSRLWNHDPAARHRGARLPKRSSPRASTTSWVQTVGVRVRVQQFLLCRGGGVAGGPGGNFSRPHRNRLLDSFLLLPFRLVLSPPILIPQGHWTLLAHGDSQLPAHERLLRQLDTCGSELPLHPIPVVGVTPFPPPLPSSSSPTSPPHHHHHRTPRHTIFRHGCLPSASGQHH